MKPRGFLATAAIAVAVAGCSGSGSAADVEPDGGFPAAPYVTLASTSGALKVEIRSSPQPPPRGIISAEFTVTRASDGAAVDGLTVSIRPWMPAMNHGATPPTVIPEGGGRYLVTELNLFMAGYWELRTTFSGASNDDVTPAFDVP